MRDDKKHGETFETELKLLTLRAHLRGKAEALAETDALIGRILAPGMGEMVQHQGEWLGDSLQSMRRITARSGVRGNALANVEMDGHPRVYKTRRPYKRASKVNPLKGKKQNWWYKLSDAEKKAITDKRVASTRAAKVKKKKEAVA